MFWNTLFWIGVGTTTTLTTLLLTTFCFYRNLFLPIAKAFVFFIAPNFQHVLSIILEFINSTKYIFENRNIENDFKIWLLISELFERLKFYSGAVLAIMGARKFNLAHHKLTSEYIYTTPRQIQEAQALQELLPLIQANEADKYELKLLQQQEIWKNNLLAEAVLQPILSEMRATSANNADSDNDAVVVN